MNLNSGSTIATGTAGFLLLLPAYFGLFLSGVPTVFSPFPALTVIPAFILSTIHLYQVAIVIPMLFFFLWQPKLFRGATVVPRRSYILYVAAAILSAVYFVESWNWGLHYQGAEFTRAVCAVNVAWVGVLGLAFRRAWSGSHSFKFNLLLHWVLFAWRGWFAFPYLGELP